MTKPIRVGIRGVSGHLGRRLVQALRRQEDMEFTLGLVREDSMKREFETVLAVLESCGTPLGGHIAEAADVAAECDVLVDATAPRASESTRACDAEMGIPVILQCSETEGRLIAPPLLELGTSSLWRQGDCLLTGLAPVIAPFAAQLTRIRADVMMQFARALNTYPMAQRIGATYLSPSVARVFKEGLATLFPRAEVKTNVRQVPGLDYYTAHLELSLDCRVSHADVTEMLERSPRVCLLPRDVMSTYEIDHLIREAILARRRDLSPITVFRDTMIPANGGHAFTIELDVAIYSRMIAVYGNIDAIRMIARGVGNIAPYDAMRATDAYGRIATSFEK